MPHYKFFNNVNYYFLIKLLFIWFFSYFSALRTMRWASRITFFSCLLLVWFLFIIFDIEVLGKSGTDSSNFFKHLFNKLVQVSVLPYNIFKTKSVSNSFPISHVLFISFPFSNLIIVHWGLLNLIFIFFYIYHTLNIIFLQNHALLIDFFQKIF